MDVKRGIVKFLLVSLPFNVAACVQAGSACVVTPQKPVLGFDLKFHSGYTALIPARGEGALTIRTRVVSAVRPNEPVDFRQRVQIPKDYAGQARIEGDFDLGEGSYHVEWLLRDSRRRICSFSWSVDASLQVKDNGMRIAMPPGVIQRSQDEQFQAEPLIARTLDRPLLNVRVLLNFAPGKPYAAALDATDTIALMSILRNISRNPEIGTFSLIVFNTGEERVVYDREYADRIDFPAVGEAVRQLRPGTVRLNQLANKHSEMDFLLELVKKNVAGNPRTDGLIFVGPKVLLESRVPQDELRQANGLDFPVFYMNYIRNPQATPWRDAIGHIVKFFKGWEYSISDPRDVWRAVAETVSRIDRSKQLRAQK